MSWDEYDYDLDEEGYQREPRDEFKTECRTCRKPILMKHNGTRWLPYEDDDEPGYRVHRCARVATPDDFEDVSR